MLPPIVYAAEEPGTGVWLAAAGIISAGLGALGAAVRWSVPRVIAYLERRDGRDADERKQRDQETREMLTRFDDAVREYRLESRDNLKIILDVQAKTITTVSELNATVRSLAEHQVAHLADSLEKIQEQVALTSKPPRKLPP